MNVPSNPFPVLRASTAKTEPIFSTKVLRWLARLPSALLLGALSIYRRTWSPLLPAFFGPGCGCRFAPSCSCYAIEAIQTHGALYGVGLATWRLLKCTPFHAGGYDPVPAKRSSRHPRCAAVPSGPKAMSSRRLPPF